MQFRTNVCFISPIQHYTKAGESTEVRFDKIDCLVVLAELNHGLQVGPDIFGESRMGQGPQRAEV